MSNELEAVPFDAPESFEAAAPIAAKQPAPQPEIATQPKRVNGNHPKATAPRAAASSLPHSIEAEEILISCCLVDGPDVIQRCDLVGVTDRSFYDQKHGIVFACVRSLIARHQPAEIYNVAEELKLTGQLEQIGGVPFLVQVSSRVPTTLRANDYIERVRTYAARRDLIRAADFLRERALDLTSDLEDLQVDARKRIDAISRSEVAGQAMDWDDLLAFDSKADADCLMGRRFLGRTGSAVIVAPSGVGKSVLALQLAACAALGVPFFGMQMREPMRVLYLQAEDDFGDVAEGAQGFVNGFGATKEQVAELRKRLRIERWNDAAGQRFLDRLRATYRRHPYDLVIINPLFSFCGCNVSEQSELSPFLRNGLNSILNETRAASIVVHHTNKPPQDPKAGDRAMEAELRYTGSGSAELTNWARAYITLQGVRQAGERVHKMVFAKRGNRTGIVNEKGEPTTSVYIEHSKTGLCWLPSDYEIEPGGKFTAKFDISLALGIYDSSKPWCDNEAAIAAAMEVSSRTVRRHKQTIISSA